ncbi:MAG: cation:dicarboxylase symporter family transporter [Alphaproteobacteria bacterium]|nr:cation:dicarboxylase symporter family transporter [Alphaproteobacteria bacterium]
MFSHSMHKFIKSFKNPIWIFAGILAGSATSIYNPVFGNEIGPFGDMIIALLKMCIIPIVLSSVVLNLAHFLNKKDDRNILKIISIYLIYIVCTSSFGVLMAIALKPGIGHDYEASPTLRKLAQEAAVVERDLNEPIEKQIKNGLVEFVIKAVPYNLFASLSKSQIFQIIIFSIIFGIALAFIDSDHKKQLQLLLEITLDVFQKIFNAVIPTLPIAVFCIMARDVSKVGGDTLMGMASFVIRVYSVVILLFLINQLIMMYRTRSGFFQVLNSLKLPMFIALATQNTIASIPSSITALNEELRLDKKIVNLLVPLGIILGRYGNILYFSFAAVFVSQLYAMELGIQAYLFIIVMAILAGISTAGSTGLVSLPMLSIVLDPLGIPIGAVLVLLLAIDAAIDPARTLTAVHANCAMISVISKRSALKNAPKDSLMPAKS